MSRVEIPIEGLYDEIRLDFERLRKPECAGCRVPLIIRRERRDWPATNWDFQYAGAARCDGCADLIETLRMDFAIRYSLSPERSPQ